jgi:hypothetical protein
VPPYLITSIICTEAQFALISYLLLQKYLRESIYSEKVFILAQSLESFNSSVGLFILQACDKTVPHGGEYMVEQAAQLKATRKQRDRKELESLIPLMTLPQ